MRVFPTILAVILISISIQGVASMSIPNDFPKFRVPAYQEEMKSLRELYWLHYRSAGPKSTMWDAWLPTPSLWPAVESTEFRKHWNNALSSRHLDKDGYVAVHQHASIAHPQGWPFPFWNQGEGGAGWHFSFKNTVGAPWRQGHLNTQEGWEIQGADDQGISESGWDLKLTSPNASISTPRQKIDTFQSPFLQLRWRASGLADARPYIEWTTDETPNFSQDRRVYFEPVDGETIAHTVVTIYKHPSWSGEINQIRIGFGNNQPGAEVTIQAFFTQYDTRHDTTGQSLIQGCAAYFHWSADTDFLRRNIERMRTALRFIMTEHQALEKKYVFNTWVGHDGRSGLRLGPDGKKEILSGHGIGDNYWDLIPFGHKDAYATMLYYDALLKMASIERDILANPDWNIPPSENAFDPDALVGHAAEVKKLGNEMFWNPETGRFIPAIDADGNIHDYGLTSLNVEAIYYDFATSQHARKIMSWLCGERVVEGDTSTGEDIYHWRFGPRATTKRNISHYYWGWSGPETIPWGGQVQDGGAVLGFSYHDLMARLKTRGPDDAWERLQETIKWFGEVQAAGGYRKYYDGSREGTLQGGGTAGGLGLDSEFFESVLVPQIMIKGFLGFEPTSDGFRLDPRLPSDWPELSIDRIHLHELVLRVRTTPNSIEVLKEGPSDEPCFVHLPKGDWKLAHIGTDGKLGAWQSPKVRGSDGAFEINWGDAKGVRFDKR